MLSETWKSPQTFAAFLNRNCIIILIAAVVYLFPTVAVNYEVSSPADGVLHAVSVFSHANIFHLLANAYCVFLIKTDLRWFRAFVIALLVSFIPAPVWSWSEMGFTFMPTCGLSAMILAAVADLFAQRTSLLRMLKYLVLPVLILTPVPNVNTAVHLYAIFLSYIYTKLEMSCQRKP